MGVLYAAAVGLGLHRHGSPWAVSTAATLVVFLPPLFAAVAASRERLLAFSGAAATWAVVGLVALPVYFPGERRDAVSTGLSLLFGAGSWDELARSVADTLPEEPEVATPELATAVEVQPAAPPPPADLGDHQIALPYEGEGRNLSIPVVFRHGGRDLEVTMLLDTGATYTTLSTELLTQLGIAAAPGDPIIRLNTANGERQATILAVDQVWLGDLDLGGVAIAVCDECASGDRAGLLGLNVAGAFNMAIDADRREVTFTRRAAFDRKLDVKPWLDLDASFARYPGGRVEVTVDVANRAARPMIGVVAAVRCGERKFTVPLGDVDPKGSAQVQRKLPAHEACPAYEIALDAAEWGAG